MMTMTKETAAPPQSFSYKQGQYNRTETVLESRARSLLASSIRTIGDGTHRYVYPTPCDSVEGVVDSTTTLVAARTFSKLGRSDLAWDFLRTLFGAQGTGGFLPRYVYLNSSTTIGEENNAVEGAGWDEFIGPYPGPKLFPEAPKGYIPPSTIVNNDKHHTHGKKSEANGNIHIWSSNTLMAPPYHTTTILEIFYLSNQTNADVQNLESFYYKLKKWHDFLHQQIIPNCTESYNSSAHHGVAPSHCFAIQHPWESEIEMTSLLWDDALHNVTEIVADRGWKPNFEIPAAVKSSFDYPGDETYNSLLYLLECLSDNARNDDNSDTDNKETSHELFQSKCPFQMLDVGFTAALSKADADLIKIGQILTDKNRIAQPSWYAMEAATSRSHLSSKMVHQLWGDSNSMFLNKLVNLTLNSNGTFSSNYTTPLELPIASYFAALWDPLSNSTMVESMTSHLLQHSGNYSFYCGDYPLWSIGGCEDSDSAIISYLLNYRVAQGLGTNKEIGLAHFLRTSSLNLICGLPNSDESDLNDCVDSQRFARAFHANSQLPVGNGECDLRSTLTAAIVIDMLIPDKAFAYLSEPPISSSSVIFLIAVELALAFGIGVTCLLLSLHLMRRATADEEGDTFVHIISERQTEEDLLVQSPMEDVGEIGAHDATNAFQIGPWSLELISRFNPMSLWERRHDG